jgi:O-antigen ligase
MAIALIVLIMARRMWLPARLGLLSLTIVSLIFSGNKSALVFSPCALITAAFISPRCFSRTGTAILRSLGILSLFGIFVLIFVDQNFELTLNIIGRDPTLSGRVQVWNYIFNQLNEPLFFGLGYGTGYGIIIRPGVSEAFGNSFSTPHNGFLDIYIGLGLVGLSLYLLLVLSALHNAISFLKSSDPDFRDLGRVALVLILFCLLSSLTDATLFYGGNPIFPTSFLLIATVIIHRCRPSALVGQNGLIA